MPVNDNPSTLNVVITRTGGTIGIGSAFTVGIVSPVADVTSGTLNYASVSSDILTITSGTEFATGNVAVPAAVPEPSYVVLLGLGVSAIGLLRMRKFASETEAEK
jgi:hypothetical protein